MSTKIDQQHFSPNPNTISLPQSPILKQITDNSRIMPKHMITSNVPSAGQLLEEMIFSNAS
jgi:hypothetical protein